MYTAIHDTIVAISSARGHAPRGIVRLSGPAAVTIANQLFQPAAVTDLNTAPGFTAHDGHIVFDHLHRLPATVYLFRQPRSYTRQDIVEFHTVGSPPILDLLVERSVAAGARPAESGEFTARAFLAGAMNLPEAEAVAATIRARSDEQLRAARRMMSGDLADQVRQWQNELADLVSLVVADIDFAEEPIDFISPEELCGRARDLLARLRALAAATGDAERLDVLPHVLLLGPPNAGKSTLLNTLSGMDRAIASAVAGTTRDILAAPVKLGMLEVIMLDAAGVDADPDEVIAQGRQKAIEAAATVDLVCLVFDATREVNAAQVKELAAHAPARTLVVACKVDLLPDEAARARKRVEYELCGVGQVCLVSAATGEGVAAFRASIEAHLTAHQTPGDHADLLLTARQRQAFTEAMAALERCVTITAEAKSILDVAEFVAFELREALDALGAVTGQVTTEDLLGRVFASFCIGK